MNCLNANFISYASQLPGGGGGGGRIQDLIFFVMIYTLKIIASMSPKSICREFICLVGYIFKEGVGGGEKRPTVLIKYLNTHVTQYNNYTDIVNINDIQKGRGSAVLPQKIYRPCIVGGDFVVVVCVGQGPYTFQWMVFMDTSRVFKNEIIIFKYNCAPNFLHFGKVVAEKQLNEQLLHILIKKKNI